MTALYHLAVLLVGWVLVPNMPHIWNRHHIFSLETYWSPISCHPIFFYCSYDDFCQTEQDQVCRITSSDYSREEVGNCWCLPKGQASVYENHRSSFLVQSMILQFWSLQVLKLVWGLLSIIFLSLWGERLYREQSTSISCTETSSQDIAMNIDDSTHQLPFRNILYRIFE